MPQPYQIIIDTNVFVAGLRSNRGASYKLLTLLNSPRWQVNLSCALVLEYEEILKQQRSQLGLSRKEIDDFLDGVCAISNRHDIFFLWRPGGRDPDDDFLVDLAVKARADFIITYNKRDLRYAQPFGIAVVSPKEFLQQMGEIE